MLEGLTQVHGWTDYRTLDLLERYFIFQHSDLIYYEGLLTRNPLAIDEDVDSELLVTKLFQLY